MQNAPVIQEQQHAVAQQDSRVLLGGDAGQEIDLTRLYQYEKQLEELATVNDLTGPMYIKDYLMACNLAADLLSRVIYLHETAEDEAKLAKSIAYLEKAPQFLEKSGRKMTESACEQYVQMDEHYRAAKDRENYLLALRTRLEQKVRIFKDAHDSSKKIYDKSASSNGAANALPSGK
jgi:hypothetical protein